MPPGRLTPLQRDVLRGFFAREQRFFLTGGAALAGFHLAHRLTDDLDLFTDRRVLDEGESALQAVCQELNATWERVRDAPEFKRYVVRREVEMVKVDLVHDPVAQSYAKQHIENVVVDPPEEILANKLCTLLQRSLLRDLVDVMMLEKQGYRVDEALPVAMKKEGALDAATLAVRLNGFRIGRGEEVPGGVSASELERYVEELVERLSRLAFPSGR